LCKKDGRLSSTELLLFLNSHGKEELLEELEEEETELISKEMELLRELILSTVVFDYCY
jgi:hypothetical protein